MSYSKKNVVGGSSIHILFSGEPSPSSFVFNSMEHRDEFTELVLSKIEVQAELLIDGVQSFTEDKSAPPPPDFGEEEEVASRPDIEDMD